MRSATRHTILGALAVALLPVAALPVRANVNLEWRPVFQTSELGQTIQIDLYAVSDNAADQGLSVVDAILQWDPQHLELLGNVDNGPYDWLASGFPDDSGFDGLNAPFSGGDPFVPANDGNALYTAWSQFNPPPAAATPDGLLVTSFEFRVVGAGVTEFVLAATAGKYTQTRVIDSDIAGLIITGTLGPPAVVHVCAGPAIVTHPLGQDACEGSPVSFEVVASGQVPLSYQWRRNGVDIAGATGEVYAIPVVAAADAGEYDVVITDACGSMTSDPATLTVSTPAMIVAEPVNTAACPGGLASFTVAATGGASISYQWRRGTIDMVDEGNVTGANAATVVISPVSVADEGIDYNCVVNTGCPPSTTSTDAALTLLECGAVVVEAVGPRYLAVTPAPGPDPLALLVSSAGASCLPQYVQADGSLDPAPVFVTPPVWGTVFVTDAEIVPSVTYDVQTESQSGTLSAASSATTFMWGDVDNNVVVNFNDIALVVRGFQGDFSVTIRQAVDLVPCVLNDDINFADINADVRAFQGAPYTETGCPSPCD